MDKLPTIKFYNFKSDEYIGAACLIVRVIKDDRLPVCTGKVHGIMIFTPDGDCYLWKTKTGYSIQKVNNR